MGVTSTTPSLLALSAILIACCATAVDKCNEGQVNFLCIQAFNLFTVLSSQNYMFKALRNENHHCASLLKITFIITKKNNAVPVVFSYGF